LNSNVAGVNPSFSQAGSINVKDGGSFTSAGAADVRSGDKKTCLLMWANAGVSGQVDAEFTYTETNVNGIGYSPVPKLSVTVTASSHVFELFIEDRECGEGNNAVPIEFNLNEFGQQGPAAARIDSAVTVSFALATNMDKAEIVGSSTVTLDAQNTYAQA